MIHNNLVRAASIFALSLISAAAVAAEYPEPKQGDWVAHDFRFHTGEVMAELRLHYTTTPEFQRQNRDFAAALKMASKSVELTKAPDYGHFEMCETLGNPYGANGRAALKLMKLAKRCCS